MIINDTKHDITIPEIVIFDWDNTLVDTWEPIHHALQVTLTTFNKPTWSLSETKLKIHRSIKDTIPEYFPEYPLEEVSKVYRDAYRALPNIISPLEKALDIIDFLKHHNVYIAIISNKQNILLNNEITALGWNNYFDVIIGSGDLEEDKPSKIPVDAVLKQKNVPTNKIWFIGDSLTDLETAYNANCLPVLFGDNGYNEASYKHCKPKLHCHDHDKLLKYLKKLWKEKV